MFDTCSGKERRNYLRRLAALEKSAERYKVTGHRPVKGLLKGFLKSLKGWTARRPRSAPISGGNAVPLFDRGTVRDREESYFSPHRIAVYTALFGPYDAFREPWICPDNIDYYVLTDQEVPEGSAWKKRDLDDSCVISQLPGADVVGFPESVLKNRFCKMFPHLIFPEYEQSVYLDTNILICSDLTALTRGLQPGSPSVFMFRHKKRDCVYDEIEACIVQHKASPERLRKEKEAIRQLGIPEHWGLLEAPLIVRRHRDEACRRLMEAWWREFLAGSGRDQPALIRALKREGLTPGSIGSLGRNLRRCSLFVQMEHQKR